MGTNGKHGFFLGDLGQTNKYIFTLKLEIVPTVWGFIFVSIVKYISMSLPMFGELYIRVMWYICLFVYVSVR